MEAYARLLEGYASLEGVFVLVSKLVICFCLRFIVIYSCRHLRHVLEDYAIP